MHRLLRTQFLLGHISIFWLAALPSPGQTPPTPANFTQLEPLPPPPILSTPEAYPGGNYAPGNLLDGNLRSEYSSNGKGTNTFLEFDFGAATIIAAFRHVDRNDPATVAASELTFLDAAGKVLGTSIVTHVNERGGE